MNQRFLFWEGLKQDIHTFVATYDTFEHNKGYTVMIQFLENAKKSMNNNPLRGGNLLLQSIQCTRCDMIILRLGFLGVCVCVCVCVCIYIYIYIYIYMYKASSLYTNITLEI
jgi:hypothetical protein